MKTIGLGMLFAAAAALGACGGGGDDATGPDAAPPACNEAGGASCFERPTVAATLEDGTTLANWNCPADTIEMATAPFMVSGTVNDFQTGNTLAGATVEAFNSAIDFSSAVTMATTDASGAYTLTLPIGTPSRMAWRMKHPDALPAFIGVNRTPGLGVLAGAIRDCDRQPVMHAIATLSSTSSVGNATPGFVSDAQVYYFSAGASLSLPVQRSIRTDSNKDGLFVIIEIPPTSAGQTYFLQVWAYKTAADVTSNTLSLVSEFESVVIGDSVIVVDMDPNQGT